MPINFPNAPAIGQVFLGGSRNWIWSGTVWNTQIASGPTLAFTIDQAAILIRNQVIFVKLRQESQYVNA
jgi:hypothetical protein